MNSIVRRGALIKHDFIQAKTIKGFECLHERLLVYSTWEMIRSVKTML